MMQHSEMLNGRQASHTSRAVEAATDRLGDFDVIPRLIHR